MKKDYIVFFDFDNTITAYDVIDDMLERFSKDDRWMELERRWKKWEIGSGECLKGQMAGIRITSSALDRYLSTVKLDPYFKRVVKLLKSKKIRVIILTDNFDYITSRILRYNNISGIDTYCNTLKVTKGRLIPSFPFINRDHRECGHCKKKNLLAKAEEASTTVYVGDGLSDLCPSREADIVFAKGSLQKYLKKEKLGYIPFKGLKDVYKYFKNMPIGGLVRRSLATEGGGRRRIGS